jgi:predicted nucleic acid-binding protein
LADLVIDSSIGACWAMPDEFSVVADRALDALVSAKMLVPSLFWYELANVLVINARRLRIDRDRIATAIEKVLALPHRTEEPAPGLSTTIAVAQAYGLTVYDAAYLELAIRSGAGLATLDKRTMAAAAAAGIDLVAGA